MDCIQRILKLLWNGVFEDEVNEITKVFAITKEEWQRMRSLICKDLS